MIRAQVSWWPGNVEVGGTHIHHLVWGILLLMIAGWVGIVVAPEPPGREIVAAVFGIGTGLTLDEFALWLELKDVYWSAEGRKSIDAVIVAGIIASFGVLGFTIWVDAADDVAIVVHALIGFVGVGNLVFGLINCAKEKFGIALLGLVVPFLSLRSARSASAGRRHRGRGFSIAARRSSRGQRSGSRTGAMFEPPARAVDAARQGARAPDPDRRLRVLEDLEHDRDRCGHGIASSAPRMPEIWAPAKSTRIAISGLTLTARP